MHSTQNHKYLPLRLKIGTFSGLSNLIAPILSKNSDFAFKFALLFKNLSILTFSISSPTGTTTSLKLLAKTLNTTLELFELFISAFKIPQDVSCSRLSIDFEKKTELESELGEKIKQSPSIFTP